MNTFQNSSTMISVMDKDFSGKKISIIGAARSGAAAAQLLKTKGAKIFVSDSAPKEKLQSSISILQSLGIEFETGSHTN